MPIAALLVLAVVAVLAILAGWFVVGRRSSRGAQVADDGGRAGPNGRGTLALPIAPRPENAFSASLFQDPVAMARSRDARGAESWARGTAMGAATAGGSDLEGPAWVRRLDPRMPVIPALKVESARVERNRTNEA